MSIFSWLFKSKKQMANPNTKWVKIGKYKITSHAQNRIVDKSRNLSKTDLLVNLFGNSKNSEIYKHENDNQYDRVNRRNRTITHITSKNNVVKTIRKFHNNSQGCYVAYKNFKGETTNGIKKRKNKN